MAQGVVVHFFKESTKVLTEKVPFATKIYNRRREPRVYPWVNPSKIFDEVARRFGGNLRFQSTTA